MVTFGSNCAFAATRQTIMNVWKSPGSWGLGRVLKLPDGSRCCSFALGVFGVASQMVSRSTTLTRARPHNDASYSPGNWSSSRVADRTRCQLANCLVASDLCRANAAFETPHTLFFSLRADDYWHIRTFCPHHRLPHLHSSAQPVLAFDTRCMC